jgi:hypothetical protein
VENLGYCDLLSARGHHDRENVLVADDAAVHDGQLPSRARVGARPAEALASAALADPFSPFICFGSG